VRGGYRLARPAKGITLLEVVEAVEGPLRGEAPPLGITPEGRRLDSRLQAMCDQAAKTVRGRLRRVSLADLAAGCGVVLLSGRAATSPATRGGGSRSGSGRGVPAAAGPATPVGGAASGARRPRSSAGRRGRALGVEREA
jgi:hypothetical protein